MQNFARTVYFKSYLSVCLDFLHADTEADIEAVAEAVAEAVSEAVAKFVLEVSRWLLSIHHCYFLLEITNHLLAIALFVHDTTSCSVVSDSLSYYFFKIMYLISMPG